MKKITPPDPDVYEIVSPLVEMHKQSKITKDQLKKKIREKVLPEGTIEGAYGFATKTYLDEAIKRADPQAKDAFWNIFFEDIKNELSDSNFRIPYYALQLEGLYDMVLLDETISLAPYGEKGSIAGPPPLSLLRFPWLRDVVDHAENEGKPVLIIGDTGTSKEAMATVIHKLSKRKDQPFVAVNCAAIPENLLESELFGIIPNYPGFHQKEGKKGIIEEADKGTLFLDEIGKTSLNLQSKLLRFVDKQEFIRLGDTKVKKADVRIIAAIHKNVVNDENHFLPDLKYRLGYPYCIKMPTLKERFAQSKGDVFRRIITNSLNFVLTKLKMRDKILKIKIAEESFKLIGAYNYTGNYRELENILMSAVYSAKRKGKDIIRPEDLSLLRTCEKANEGVKAASENIKLKDIFSYADKVKGYIVEAKIREVIDSGRDIYNVLDNEYKQEGQTLTDSQYIQFTKNVEKVTGKKISAFKKMRKNQE